MIKVLIDTNIIKATASGPLRYIPVNKPIRNWWGKKIGFQVSTVGHISTIDKAEMAGEAKKKQLDEMVLLEKIANHAKAGTIELFEESEMTIESLGLPDIQSHEGRFYGAPIKVADPPLTYERMITSPYPSISREELSLLFFKGIDNKRFKELQKVTGAYRGGDNYSLNQLIDAFFLWSAEHNNVDYFLTLDFKLIRMVNNDNSHNIHVKLVRPSELLKLIEPQNKFLDK